MADHQVSDNIDDVGVVYVVGSLPDGRALIDFRGRAVDHLKLEQDVALDMAEALVEAVRDARQGIITHTGFVEPPIPKGKG